MRKFMLSALLGLGALGVTAATPIEAKASWLSEALNNSQIQVNIGTQYRGYAAPQYAAPQYAPVPFYPVYNPVPAYTQPAYRFNTAPVYATVPAVPAYRPAPVNVPQHSYYGPNRFERDRYDWHDGRNDHDWRR